MKIPEKGDVVFSDEDGWYGLLLKDGIIEYNQVICTVLVLRRDQYQIQVGKVAEWKLSQFQIW